MSRENALVTADWAEENLDAPGVVFVEVDEDTTAYDGGHIPGAVKIDWKTELQDQVRRDFVDKAGFEKLLSAKGISERRHRRALRRQQQLVRRLRLLVLQALRPPGREAARRRAQEVGARRPHARRRGALAAGHRLQGPGAGPLDPRVPRRGRRRHRDQEPGRRPLPRRVRRAAARPGAPAAGAGAACRAHPDARPTSRGARPRTRTAPSAPTSELRELYGEAGLDPDARPRSPTAASASAPRTPGSPCTSCSASTDVKNYDGSWTEYGSLVGVPIETGDERG